MTVQELIDKLSSINPDRIVRIKGLTTPHEYWDGEIIALKDYPEITIVGNGV